MLLQFPLLPVCVLSSVLHIHKQTF